LRLSLPRWHWQAQASLAMHLLTAAVEAAGALAAAVVAEWEGAVATAVVALARAV
jgi:hypothetical protein